MQLPCSWTGMYVTLTSVTCVEGSILHVLRVINIVVKTRNHWGYLTIPYLSRKLGRSYAIHKTIFRATYHQLRKVCFWCKSRACYILSGAKSCQVGIRPGNETVSSLPINTHLLRILSLSLQHHHQCYNSRKFTLPSLQYLVPFTHVAKLELNTSWIDGGWTEGNLGWKGFSGLLLTNLSAAGRKDLGNILTKIGTPGYAVFNLSLTELRYIVHV